MSDLPQVGSDFGYRFEPPCAPDRPCHRVLTVVMRAVATERHYDPEKIDCRVATPRGEIENLVISHPWSLLNEYRVAAGRVVIMDRRGKKVEAFTFGGTLRLASGADQLTAVFESPAPILALLPENPLLGRVAAEAEGLLARRQAAWDSNGQPEKFEARLAAADPQAIYHSCLQALGRALSTGSVFGGASDRELHHLLAAEHVSGQTATLEELI